ncbi:NCS2 family permease [Telmatospirillum sp. J64-1]|uniref:NCS2 family permease n=1 Tax=Telmatospirillum sp. J64-1 TaxID=2502183 RepID=UPI00115CA343|nr:NCS2 family permease [Telmatospirillum sp. J64-1]
MLERFFHLQANGTTVRTEVLAGFTTFLTMAYIVFVNPAILADAGMDRGAVFTATCLAAVIGTMIMGLLANYPIAQAPGMGMNAFFTYTIVIGMGHTWQVALGCVFISGILFVALSLFKVREWVINAVPRSLKMSIAAGIGFFIGFIALKNAGFVVAHPATLVGIGDLTRPEPILAALGFAIMVALHAWRVPGSILIAILAVTVLSGLFGLVQWQGIVSTPPSLAPTFMQMDLAGALEPALISVIFTLLFLDLFDTAGTLIGTGHAAGLLDEKGRLPRIGKALFADSTATVAGSVLGTSNTTSYIESLSGIEQGGRTGLTAVVVGLLFLLALFFAPLAGTIPAFATASALFFVACLMARGLVDIDWKDVTEFAPALVAAITMPLTFSIATGIGLAFIAYAGIKLISGRAREAGIAIYLIAGAFVLKFAFL